MMPHSGKLYRSYSESPLSHYIILCWWKLNIGKHLILLSGKVTTFLSVFNQMANIYLKILQPMQQAAAARSKDAFPSEAAPVL